MPFRILAWRLLPTLRLLYSTEAQSPVVMAIDQTWGFE